MPDVIGLGERNARSALKAAGLEPVVQQRTVTDPDQDGVVVEQKPEAGTPLAEALDCHLKLARVAPEEPLAETEERP